MADSALPVWSQIDAEAEYAAARAGLAELALSGATTVFDHHYVFPAGRSGLVEAEVQAAKDVGVRLVASRGSMDVGQSDGGLPPDDLVEDPDDVLADTEGLAVLHEDGPERWTQIAVAPCSPFSVSKQLMTESAELARKLGLICTRTWPRRSRRRSTAGPLRVPPDRVPRAGGLARRRRLVPLRPPLARRRAPLRPGGHRGRPLPELEPPPGRRRRPVRSMLDEGVRVGLGVDGSASNERADLLGEAKQALLVARGQGGPRALTARDALASGRGAAPTCSAAATSARSSRASADFAVWRTDSLQFGGADDLVAALVLAGPHPVERLYVGGRQSSSQRSSSR